MFRYLFHSCQSSIDADNKKNKNIYEKNWLLNMLVIKSISKFKSHLTDNIVYIWLRFIYFQKKFKHI